MLDPIDTFLGGLHANVRITRAMLATMTITILISGMCSEIVLRCCEALSMRWLAYCIFTSQPILCDCESGCRTLAIRQKRYQVVLKPAQRLSSRSRSGPAPRLVLLQVWSQKSVFFILVCSAATREHLLTFGVLYAKKMPTNRLWTTDGSLDIDLR